MACRVVATCDLPQPAAPTPHGWTSRRAPAGRSRSAGPAQRSAHGGGSPEAPEDESPIAQEEDAGETEDKRGFESASGEAWGDSNSLVWLGLGFFSFFCLADMVKRRSGSPGLTLSELGTGIGLKAGKWVRCHSPSGCMQRYKNTRHTHTHTPGPRLYRQGEGRLLP